MAKSDKQQRKPQATPPSAPAPSAPQTSRPGLPASIRWFLSKRVRQATAMRKHVQKLLNHQRDILAPQAIEAVEVAIGSCRNAVADNADNATLEKQMENLENVAGKWIKPYPSAAWRENVEVLLVALTVAMGIRTFFLQPFKIPTGSMQPTLFGVTSVPDFSRGRTPEMEAAMTNMVIPTGWQRVREWFAGVSYIQVKAARAGVITAVTPPFMIKRLRVPIFSLYQDIYINGEPQTIWFPPDYGSVPLEVRANLQVGQQVVREGEEIVRLRIAAGDHLFVDRLSYNFRSPERGEIIVFETKGIDNLPQDQFYIKRMVAKSREQVQLGEDRHLIINGKRLDASTPHFENVYSFNPKEPPRDSHYSGHVNFPFLAPYFQDKPNGVTVAPDHYMVMGDNTMNSLDSRSWGDFPATNVIGKSFFVYWPITDRFGWGNR